MFNSAKIKTLEFEIMQLRQDLETLATQYDALRERSDKIEKQNQFLKSRTDTLFGKIEETLDNYLDDRMAESIEAAIERKISDASISIDF